MDDQLVALVIIGVRGFGMILLILGGFFQIRYGYRVYSDGHSTEPSKTELAFGKFRMKTDSAGALLMGTAAFWAWAGVVVSPFIPRGEKTWRVYSFGTSGAQISAKAVSLATKTPDPVGALGNPEKLKDLFYRAVTTSKTPLAYLEKQPAVFDLNSVRTLKSDTGIVLVATDIESGSKSATVAYRPTVSGSYIVFQPAGVGSTTSAEEMVPKSFPKESATSQPAK